MRRLRRPSPTSIAFGGLLAAGAALRVYAMVAYSPAVVSAQAHDGAAYVGAARRGFATGNYEPAGYPAFLRVVHAVRSELAFTISVQHAMGLATGVLLFLIVRRLGAPGWVGLAPAAVVWLGGDQVFLEHAPMSEALFTPLLAATQTSIHGYHLQVTSQTTLLIYTATGIEQYDIINIKYGSPIARPLRRAALRPDGRAAAAGGDARLARGFALANPPTPASRPCRGTRGGARRNGRLRNGQAAGQRALVARPGALGLGPLRARG